MPQLAGNAHWAEPSPLFAHRARPTPLKCENEYPVLPLGEETAVQAVVWAFRRLKKSRRREMSARGYALHSVFPQLHFSYVLKSILFLGFTTNRRWGRRTLSRFMSSPSFKFPVLDTSITRVYTRRHEHDSGLRRCKLSLDAMYV